MTFDARQTIPSPVDSALAGLYQRMSSMPPQALQALMNNPAATPEVARLGPEQIKLAAATALNKQSSGGIMPGMGAPTLNQMGQPQSNSAAPVNAGMMIGQGIAAQSGQPMPPPAQAPKMMAQGGAVSDTPSLAPFQAYYNMLKENTPEPDPDQAKNIVQGFYSGVPDYYGQAQQSISDQAAQQQQAAKQNMWLQLALAGARMAQTQGGLGAGLAAGLGQFGQGVIGIQQQQAEASAKRAQMLQELLLKRSEDARAQAQQALGVYNTQNQDWRTANRSAAQNAAALAREDASNKAAFQREVYSQAQQNQRAAEALAAQSDKNKVSQTIQAIKDHAAEAGLTPEETQEAIRNVLNPSDKIAPYASLLQSQIASGTGEIDPTLMALVVGSAKGLAARRGIKTPDASPAPDAPTPNSPAPKAAGIGVNTVKGYGAVENVFKRRFGFSEMPSKAVAMLRVEQASDLSPESKAYIKQQLEKYYGGKK